MVNKRVTVIVVIAAIFMIIVGVIIMQQEPIEEIDISTLGQGIYIIEIITSELKFRQKLIIKK